MRYTTSLNFNITVAFAVTLLIVIFIGIVSHRSIHAFIGTTEVVNRSHQIITTIEATLGDIVTAESEARGYIISGNEHYLNLYRTALQEIDADFQALRSTVTNPNVLNRINRLEQLTRKRLARLETTVTTRRLEGLDAIADITGPGKALMDELREEMAAINALETAVLRGRDQRAEALGRHTIKAVVAGIVFAVVLALVSLVAFARDAAQRARLEREILSISEREQRRIGQDLHDGVCQQLTGTALLSRSLQMKLATKSAAEADEATRITNLLNDTIEQTRKITRGLHPVVEEPGGLMQALQELVGVIDGLGNLACRFDCPKPVPVANQVTATHLYRIAQEAVQNAIRHARPTAIVIGLRMDRHTLSLTIADDGCGMPAQQTRRGMGLAIMNYRAHTIGGVLRVGSGEPRGTVVTCTVPEGELT